MVAESDQERLIEMSRLEMAELLMGLVTPEEVVRWASELITEVSRPSALVDLASTVSPRESDVNNSLRHLIAELGGAPLGLADAALIVSRRIAKDISSGNVAPYDGARVLWWTIRRRAPEIESLLRPFVGLASEWEDHPSARPQYEQSIREAAQVLLEST
jgi:hypothetical protein